MIRACLAVLLLFVTGSGFAVEYNPPEDRIEGEIHKLDFAGQTLRLQALDFSISPDVRVEIGGDYGAFTLLEVGMAVEMRFWHYADGRREVFEIKQLAASRVPLVR